MKLNKPSVMRLARRAGVKTMADNCVDTVNDILIEHLDDILRSSLVVHSLNNNNTLSAEDVVNGLTFMGHNVTYSDKMTTTKCPK